MNDTTIKKEIGTNGMKRKAAKKKVSVRISTFQFEPSALLVKKISYGQGERTELEGSERSGSGLPAAGIRTLPAFWLSGRLV